MNKNRRNKKQQNMVLKNKENERLRELSKKLVFDRTDLESINGSVFARILFTTERLREIVSILAQMEDSRETDKFKIIIKSKLKRICEFYDSIILLGVNKSPATALSRTLFEDCLRTMFLIDNQDKINEFYITSLYNEKKMFIDITSDTNKATQLNHLLEDIKKKMSFAGINYNDESDLLKIPDNHRKHEKIFPPIQELELTYLGKPIGIVGLFNLGSSSVHGDFIDLANYHFEIKDSTTAEFKNKDGIPFDSYCLAGLLISKTCVKMLEYFNNKQFANILKISFNEFEKLFMMHFKILHHYRDSVIDCNDLEHLECELWLEKYSATINDCKNFNFPPNFSKNEKLKKHMPISEFSIEIQE